MIIELLFRSMIALYVQK